MGGFRAILQRFTHDGQPSWVNLAVSWLFPSLIALLAFALLVLVFGENPFATYRDILDSALGSAFGWQEVGVIMIPLVLTAVAVSIPARIGLVNVGGEGQLFIGAMFGSFVALNFTGLPGPIMIPLMLLFAFVGGGLWALMPAILRARGWMNEVISTLLLNFVAISLVGFVLFGVWRDPSSTNYPRSESFVNAAIFPDIAGRFHIGFVFALAAIILFYVLMRYTRWGYEMRAIGGNPDAARIGGIPTGWYIVVAMFVGGGIAGVAGISEASAIQGQLIPRVSGGIGYVGFLISWMAGHSPVRILPLAFLVAVIASGADSIQFNQGLPGSAVNVLMALVLFVVLARSGFKARTA